MGYTKIALTILGLLAFMALFMLSFLQDIKVEKFYSTSSSPKVKSYVVICSEHSTPRWCKQKAYELYRYEILTMEMKVNILNNFFIENKSEDAKKHLRWCLKRGGRVLSCLEDANEVQAIGGVK